MPRAFLVRKGRMLHSPWKPEADATAATTQRGSSEGGVQAPELRKEEAGISNRTRKQENGVEDEEDGVHDSSGSGVPSRVSWPPLPVLKPPPNASRAGDPAVSALLPFTSAPASCSVPTADSYHVTSAIPYTPSSGQLSLSSSSPVSSFQNATGNAFTTKVPRVESFPTLPPTSSIQETFGNVIARKIPRLESLTSSPQFSIQDSESNVPARKVPRLEALTSPFLTSPLSDSEGNGLTTKRPRLEALGSSPGIWNVDSAVGEIPRGDVLLKNAFPSPFLNPGLREAPSNHPFVLPPSSLPLSPAGRESFFPTPQHMFSSPPPGIVRPIPTSGLPWPIQPIPLRVPLGLRPNFGLCGVTSPEEVPSPPGSSVPDMPSSPILGLKSGLSSLRAYGLIGDMDLGVDVNNNNNNNSNNHTGGGGGGGVRCRNELMSDESRRQNFKEFLEYLQKANRFVLQTAKVRVETINDGNGLKNPLLSPDSSRLALDSGPLSFMTLDTFPACPVCALTCDTPRLLQRHVRSHKEIKRYLCAWCGKGFNDTFDLKRHTRTHTGVRPYKCECCGKAFSQRCSLESHSRKIHGQVLPFTFNERRAKLYVCEECGHSTPSLDLHFEHLRAQHPGHPALERPHHDRRQFKYCGEDDVSDVGVDVVGEDGEEEEGMGGGLVEGQSGL
ncbi:hypothetical protein ACOMHN_007587 [Nucella lapillus]